MRVVLGLIALTLLPGLPLLTTLLRRAGGSTWNLAVAGALGILWSILTSLLLTLAQRRMTAVALILLNSLPLVVVVFVPRWRTSWWHALRAFRTPLADAVVLVLTVAVLAYPLISVQRGLPTGDIQKSLFWAGRILAEGHFPDYGEAERWNRDPADFATPGLHTLTAAIITLTGDFFRGPAWFSLAAAVILAGVVAALGALLDARDRLLPTLAFIFAATNVRFLRYTVTPGYHYQNLIGELVLVLSLLFLIRTVGGRGGLRYLAVAGIAAALLPLLHQFTAFLALFILPPVFAILVVRYRAEATTLLRQFSALKRRLLLGLLLISGVSAVLAAGPLREKFPHLFTTAPHLRPYVVPLDFIPSLVGELFLFLSIAGALGVLLRLRKRELEWRWILVLVWAVLVIGLSQGPRWVLDIPSARTLFYAIMPLALLAASVVASAVSRIRQLWPRAAPFLAPTALALAIAPTAGSAMNTSLLNVDHALQANATLTPATLELLEFLKRNPPNCVRGILPPPCPDGILIDDWNRRRATWTLLSPYRMLTRVGADLAVIARESHQSEQRRRQYETLLDFEKVYSIGNSPAIRALLETHGVAYIIAANGLSDDVFAHNPALEVAYQNGEITVFRLRAGLPPAMNAEEQTSLLDPLTLTNDIGDAEDVFAHLPLSILAPTISEPHVDGTRTTRDIESTVSAIGLNVGSYVPQLWDPDGNAVIDQPVDLQLSVVGNGARWKVTRGTTVYASFAVPDDGDLHRVQMRIPKGHLVLDDHGIAFLTLRLDQGPLRLDAAAARFVR